MPKSLKQKCIFVKGAKNAAIYDLKNKKIYAINHVGKSILEKFLANPNSFTLRGLNILVRFKN